MKKRWFEIALAGAAIVVLARTVLSKEEFPAADRAKVSAPSQAEVLSVTKVAPKKKSFIGKARAAVDRAEGKLDARLDKIPAWLSSASAFASLLFGAVVAFLIDDLPATGPFSSMNLVFLSVILFFAAVGIVPKTNARFWSIFGALAGILMWIVALMME
ncbi:TPA: hypothetical protein ACOEBF_000044 [Stenotrophomonas maltophilia]|uniref:hypothetical protein n=1 Tax=Stenotrophomonas maltophilia TaxID=40324 RepID=UPI00209BB09E|nr:MULTISPECIES: hypothetical protein [Stenotrophomonas]MCO7495973.1 hypothetical protein [Stenotrophomonas maltophilia]